jgi:hypothetical protein
VHEVLALSGAQIIIEGPFAAQLNQAYQTVIKDVFE